MAQKSQTRTNEKTSSEQEKQRQNRNLNCLDSSVQPEWQYQAVETPFHARAEDILALQRRFGNQAVQRVLDPTIRRRPVTNAQGDLRQDLAEEIKDAGQGGQPLSTAVREGMGQQLGHDFSKVRIHTDRRADTLNCQLQARAFTVGNNIFFSQGAFDPQTTQGRHTLAHELTHVVQQSGGSGGSPLKLGKPDDRYEREADHIAASGEVASMAGLAAGVGIVQRVPTWAGVKSFFGSRFSGRSGSAASAIQQPGASTPPLPSQQLPESSPEGVSAGDWKKLKANGVTDAATWSAFSEEKKRTILSVLASNQKLAKLLIEGAKQYYWPQDVAGAELHSVVVLRNIFGTTNISISDWNLFGDRRSTILECMNYSAVPLGLELINAARKDYWPKDGADADIIKREEITRIKVHLHISLMDWSKFNKGRRAVILTAFPLNSAWAMELAGAAKAAGTWPKDSTDQDILEYSIWNDIKEAARSLMPTQWNTLPQILRGQIIAAPTQVEKKNLINQGLYQSSNENTLFEKVSEYAEHPVIEGLSGTAGTASSIAGALDKSKTSGIIGATADVGDTLVQSISLLGSISKFRRGKRLENKGLSSRAAQSLGKKQKREGIWGIAQSTLGLGGSISSAVGNISMGANPERDEEQGVSDVTDKVSGSFAIAAGAMGSVKGGMGLFRSFRRSKKSKEYIDEAATGDKKTLSEIAGFTQKKQNKIGRTLETFKGVSTILSGVASILGNDTFAAVMGGLGLASGIGQAITSKVGEPNEAELNRKAEKLVDLLKRKNQDAIKFAKEVLKITGVTPDTPEGWEAWVMEDPEAAKDLIKSKLSKY